MESMGIGALAKRASVGIDTVRYYERAGLLNPGHGRAADCPILLALGADEG